VGLLHSELFQKNTAARCISLRMGCGLCPDVSRATSALVAKAEATSASSTNAVPTCMRGSKQTDKAQLGVIDNRAAWIHLAGPGWIGQFFQYLLDQYYILMSNIVAQHCWHSYRCTLQL